MIGIMWVLWDILLAIFLGLFFLCICIAVLYYVPIYTRLVFLCICGLCVGGAISYMHIDMIHSNAKTIERYMWQYISQVWEVRELYKRNEYYDEYILELRLIWETEVSERLNYIVRLPKNFSLDIGEIISFSGKLYPLEDFDGFSYNKFMLSRGIYYSTSLTNFETLENPQDSYMYTLSKYRQGLLNRISRIFPEKESIFLAGILLWARENIPKDVKEDFNNSWLTHFIAVSGFNITLCIIFVTFLFGFLPVYGRIFVVSFTIILFSFFVGLWAPVVRAAIMWIIGYVFLQWGSTPKNITLILFTAVCMGIYSPLSLVYDVSLHLSFLAVIGIIYTQEMFLKMFSWMPSLFAIREAFVLTLSALSFSIPIMMFQFGQVSLLAPFANIAVTWTIPLAMLGGSITLIWDIISPTLWNILWFLSWILLHYDMLMVAFFWNLEFALIRFDFGAYKNYLQASEKQSETTISKLKQGKQL